MNGVDLQGRVILTVLVEAAEILKISLATAKPLSEAPGRQLTCAQVSQRPIEDGLQKN